MPILLLVFGIALLLFFLIVFQKNATVSLQKTFWRFVLFVIIPAVLFYLIILGRSLPALLVLFIVLPLVVGEIKSLRKGRIGESIADAALGANDDVPINLTREEALNVLGLDGEPSDEDIKAAHAKLIKKNHPDQDGNVWLASKINAARDILLEKNDKDI